MPLSETEKKKLSELRKIERQAKQLIYKMQRLEKTWKELRAELKESGRNLPNSLGDILFSWNRIGR